MQEGNSEIEIDLRSNRQDERLNQNDSEYRFYLNTNLSENSGLTVEVSSQMSRKFEGMKSDLSIHILDKINSAIEEKVIPSFKNAIGSQNGSDGPHPSNFNQIRPQRDFQSNGLHHEKVNQVAQDARKDLPRLVAMRSNQTNHRRENFVDSNQTDDDGYDMVTRDNLTPQRVPEFPTRRPMQPPN